MATERYICERFGNVINTLIDLGVSDSVNTLAKDLGYAAGISLYNVINYRNTPSRKMLEKLYSRFNLDMGYFFGTSEQMFIGPPPANRELSVRSSPIDMVSRTYLQDIKKYPRRYE